MGIGSSWMETHNENFFDDFREALVMKKARRGTGNSNNISYLSTPGWISPKQSSRARSKKTLKGSKKHGKG